MVTGQAWVTGQPSGDSLSKQMRCLQKKGLWMLGQRQQQVPAWKYSSSPSGPFPSCLFGGGYMAVFSSK